MKTIEENAAEMRAMLIGVDAAQAKLAADTDAAVARVLTELAGKPELHELVRALYGARGLVPDAISGSMPAPSALARLLAEVLAALGQ